MKYSSTNYVTGTVVTHADAYGDGDVVGEAVHFPRACGKYSRGVLKTVIIRDPGNEASPFTLLFFNEEPTSIAADNAALTLAAADLARLVGIVSIAAGDYIAIGGAGVCRKDVGDVIVGAKGNTETSVGDLWMVVVSEGTDDFDGATLSFSLGILSDGD